MELFTTMLEAKAAFVILFTLDYLLIMFIGVSVWHFGDRFAKWWLE